MQVLCFVCCCSYTLLISCLDVFGVLLWQVQEVVLVELREAHVQHAANVRIILEQIAPSALLTVLSAARCDKS